MRNPVSRHDFNRASTHVDRSKEPQLTIEDGLDDYEEEKTDEEAFCQLEKELFEFIYRKPMSN